MTKGYMGKILFVDLNTATCHVEQPTEKFYRTYFGGRNLIAYYLLNGTKKGVDPLSPENRLIFATGIVTGAPIGGSGRNSVGAKSPLTGLYGEAEAGGYFGSELKKAGYDAVVIDGKADKPVYLYITDQSVDIRGADKIWGTKVANAYQLLREDTGEKMLRAAVIGPAGEKMVPFACILNDINHAYGRTGMGAVMGSKNLKAVTVRGKGKVAVSDVEKIRSISKWLADNVNEYCGWLEKGTMSGVLDNNDIHGLPTKNHQSGYFADAHKISAETMYDTITVGKGTCHACPVRCKQRVKVDSPWQVDPVYGGPEYETAASFGSMCEVSDIKAIAKANEICNAYGLDTITTGSMVAFAMECFENGLLTLEQTGGIELRFGNSTAMVETVQKIALRKGIGEILSCGPMKAAKLIGGNAKDYIIHVKNLPFPYHDCRVKQGMSIGYATLPVGADHCSNIFDEFYVPDSAMVDELHKVGILEGLEMTDLSVAKVRLYAYMSLWPTLFNNLTMCTFMPFSIEQVVDIVNAISGWNCSYFELFKVAERSLNLARVFNFREGMDQKADSLPRRVFEVPTGRENKTLDEKEFNEALQVYYGMMGWDSSGRPGMAKLQELNIAWAGRFLAS